MDSANKIWIARDLPESSNSEEDWKEIESILYRFPEKRYEFCRLKFFYDSPVFNIQLGIWEGGRCFAILEPYCNLYPQIKEGQCCTFELNCIETKGTPTFYY